MKKIFYFILLISFSKHIISQTTKADSSKTKLRAYVAIISNVTENEIEIIQQNLGPFGKSRVTFELSQKSNKWSIKNEKVLGWLRKD